MLRSFAYHGLTVSDLEKSLAFYRDLLEMKVESAYELKGEDFAELTGFPGAHSKVAILSFGGRFLKLSEYLHPKGRKYTIEHNDVGASHIGIHVDNLEETYEKLHAKGVRFITPPVSSSTSETGSVLHIYV